MQIIINHTDGGEISAGLSGGGSMGADHRDGRSRSRV